MSKIKTFLRKAKARAIETLIEAIKQALATISKSDVLAWFAHCGLPYIDMQHALELRPRWRDEGTHDTKGECLAHIDRVWGDIAGSIQRKWGLQERMKFYKVPALSIAVIKDYKVHWAATYGVLQAGSAQRANSVTMFQVASISKPVTALAVLALAQSGRLSLSADVNDYLQGWKLQSSSPDIDTRVTLEQLLSHTGGTNVHGFAGYPSDDSAPGLMDVLTGASPATSPRILIVQPPGSAFRYSGGGYTIVQKVLCDLTGQSFPDLMAQLLLRPLGMAHSTFEQPLSPSRATNAAAGHLESGAELPGRWRVYPEMAAAGLWTTAADLAKVIIEIQKSHTGRPGSSFKRANISDMLNRRLGPHGLGVEVTGNEATLAFEHRGKNPGYQSRMIGYANLGLGVVIIANSDAAGGLINELVRSVSETYSWPTNRQEVKTIAEVDFAVMSELVGRYKVGSEFATVSLEGGKLYFRLGMNEACEILPESNSRYFMMIGRNVEFQRDSAGRVRSLTLDGRLTAPKID